MAISPVSSRKRRGILLINLGSPDSPSKKDVRRYLDEFLMDPRVIDKAWLPRALLVRGIIVPFRTPKSAHAYSTIWTSEGSPLIVLTRQLCAALEAQLGEPVEMCMRYGNPHPDAGFRALLRRVPDLEEVFVIPLYPHYAMSSFETAVEHVREAYQRGRFGFSLSFLRPFYAEPEYIRALAVSMRPWLDQGFDHVLFSFHGVPERHIHKGDISGNHCLRTTDCCSQPSIAHAYCYRHQCLETMRLVMEELDVPREKYSYAFQSRLGKGWLRPYTDEWLGALVRQGVKNLLVVCPAFVSDCLETLEEIAEGGKKIFLEAGGEQYQMIPCLNLHPDWVSALAAWTRNAEHYTLKT